MRVTVVLPKNYEPIQLPYFTEWVTALESGEYEQGKYFLCSNNQYCCLGVLSKIQGRLKEGGFGHWIDDSSTLKSSLSASNPCNAALGELGKFPSDVIVEVDNFRIDNLALMNDRQIPFKEIAQVIKQIWKA